MLIPRRVWIWGGVAVGVVVVGLVAVRILVNADTYRGRIEAALTQSLGRPVTLGHLDASVLSGSLVADAPSIADDPAFNSGPFLTAKDVKIGVEMAPLVFHHELHITSFTIDEPKIVLIRAEDGTWNYSSLGSGNKNQASAAAGNPLPNLSVKNVDIADGTLTMGTRPSVGPAREYSDVNVSLKNFSFATPFSFTMSGKLPGDGSVEISGDAGPIAKDASLTPVTAQVQLQQADLAAAGLVDASAGIGGLADLDAKMVSNGQTVQAEGKLTLTKVRLAKNGTPSEKPVDADFQVGEDLRTLTGTVDNLSLKVGGAALTAAGTFATRGNVTTTQLNVSGQNMPIDDLEAFLPSLGVQLPAGSRMQGGTLTTAVTVSGPLGSASVDGTVRVANTQLAGFNLGSALSSVAALGGAKMGSTTTIQQLSSKVHYGPDGIRTDNVDAVVSGLGSATGSGTISPGGALNYRLVVTLSSGLGAVTNQAVGMLSGALGMGSAGTKGGIPVKIGGTTSNPTFMPDVGGMVGGMVPKNVPAQKSVTKALGGLFGR